VPWAGQMIFSDPTSVGVTISVGVLHDFGVGETILVGLGLGEAILVGASFVCLADVVEVAATTSVS